MRFSIVELNIRFVLSFVCIYSEIVQSNVLKDYARDLFANLKCR